MLKKLKVVTLFYPLAQKEAEVFGKKFGKSVTVIGGGSGVGIAALLEGTTDIAMSSRKMKFDEKVKFQESGKSLVEKIIAYDALAVIVHPSNGISKLTRAQLESIFTGKVSNWKQVGGADLKIIPYSRESSSGTYEFFKEHILMNKNYVSSILSMPATGSIIQSVSQTKGAIAYVGLAYLDKSVKEIAVSFDGKTFVVPNEVTAKNKTYPVIRPLYFYMDKKAEVKSKPLVDFIMSAEGQKIVEQVGYVPLK
jgi:phosphate transport system substrate-binding protein